MSAIARDIAALLNLYQLILIGRLIFEYIRMFAQQWRPQGFLLLVAEFLYSVTDPPLRVVRRVVPPVRIGGAYLDLSYIVLFIGISIIRRLLFSL
ncbi:MAG: YggT family protein [Actinomycetes bacterium]